MRVLEAEKLNDSDTTNTRVMLTDALRDLDAGRVTSLGLTYQTLDASHEFVATAGAREAYELLGGVEMLRDLTLRGAKTYVTCIDSRSSKLEAPAEEPAPAVETGFEYLPEGALEKLRAAGIEPLKAGEKADDEFSVWGWWLTPATLASLLANPGDCGWFPDRDQYAGKTEGDAAPLLLFRRKEVSK